MSLEVNDRVIVRNGSDTDGREGVALRVKATFAYVLLDGEEATRFYSRDDLRRLVTSETDKGDTAEALAELQKLDTIRAEALSTYDKQVILAGLDVIRDSAELADEDPFSVVVKALRLASRALGL